MNNTTRLWYLLLIALALVLLGAGLAAWIQTNGGTVAVHDVRFVGTNGTMMSGLLYVPKGVTAKNPAPGIVAIHGYINSRETQSGFAIEFARRGYVVLALDQTGHGYSAPPAFANGFGGPDGLRYLRSLDIVDKNNIGLEGHSMGGWASVIAAQTFPNDYQAIVLEGSSTGTFGGITGTATFPRNLGLVFAQYDEFSNLMWGAPIPRDIVKTRKLQTQFGTTESVEVGKLYGSIADGTARKLYMPAETHPQNHLSTEAIGSAIEWFQTTLKGGNNLPPSDQIWMWKEIGTLIAFIGLVFFFFPFGALLLKTDFFKPLAEPLPEFKGVKGVGWWLAAFLIVAIPIVSYYWAQRTTYDWIKPSSPTSPVTLWPMIGSTPIWPQNITTGLMGWAVFNGVVSLILFVLWHFFINKKTGATATNYGVTWNGKLDWGKIGKSLLLAIIIAFVGHLILSIAEWWLKVDFRFWVLALKPMSFLRFQIFLGYLIPFTFFFLVLSTALHGQLRVNGSVGREMVINAVMLALGFVILLLFQYIPFFGGGTLALAAWGIGGGEPLLTIIAIQVVPLMIIIGLISTFFYHKTGKIYVGAFLNALFITWYIVAGQAIHFAL